MHLHGVLSHIQIKQVLMRKIGFGSKSCPTRQCRFMCVCLSLLRIFLSGAHCKHDDFFHVGLFWVNLFNEQQKHCKHCTNLSALQHGWEAFKLLRKMEDAHHKNHWGKTLLICQKALAVQPDLLLSWITEGFRVCIAILQSLILDSVSPSLNRTEL